MSSDAWPPRGEGASAALAFRAEEVPTLANCIYCSTEVGYGADATFLEVELRTCSRCPPDPAIREAIRGGIEVGARAASEPDAGYVADNPVTLTPPYEFGSTRWHAWKRGWWAGYFATDADPRRRQARRALDFCNGALRRWERLLPLPPRRETHPLEPTSPIPYDLTHEFEEAADG